MKPFHESLRYEYPLTPDSIVIDLGCHKGTFSKILSERYECKILAFEPIKQFYDIAKDALANNSNVLLLNEGLGAYTRIEEFGVKGDMSGAFADGEREEVFIMCLSELDVMRGKGDIDLIKINIEGGEFEILEYIVLHDLATRFKNIQVQFHPVVPLYHERHAGIREALLKTHRLTYDAPWCWENYERI